MHRKGGYYEVFETACWIYYASDQIEAGSCMAGPNLTFKEMSPFPHHMGRHAAFILQHPIPTA